MSAEHSICCTAAIPPTPMGSFLQPSPHSNHPSSTPWARCDSLSMENSLSITELGSHPSKLCWAARLLLARSVSALYTQIKHHTCCPELFSSSPSSCKVCPCECLTSGLEQNTWISSEFPLMDYKRKERELFSSKVWLLKKVVQIPPHISFALHTTSQNPTGAALSHELGVQCCSSGVVLGITGLRGLLPLWWCPHLDAGRAQGIRQLHFLGGKRVSRKHSPREDRQKQSSAACLGWSFISCFRSWKQKLDRMAGCTHTFLHGRSFPALL